jgi:SAM-dependent methyltransferase
MSEAARLPPSNLPTYFNKLSQTYPKSTGRSTEKLFERLLPRLAPVTSQSIIHDNASGPATATGVLLSDAKIAAERPKLVCTDMVEAMINATKELVREKNWWNVESKVMKSDVATEFPDTYFSHSITNFSIFNFTDRVTAASEIYRTLRPGGQVIVSTWKIFTVGEIIREAQRRIRPDSKPMPFSGPDMYDGNAVLNVLVQGGFVREQLEVVAEEHSVTGEDLEGIIAFAKSPFTSGAREGWTDDEKESWGKVIDEVVNEYKKQDASGGILTQMWAVIGTK